ncbi:hypothetical protein BROUX41_001342 [Berkeleyomyces rouxiae]|uniref:uncharacterized protein n=1 Tax=Berkeleyomyces rouxiae TaxID=2035830 RepID=UPI003B795E33
MSSPTSRMSHDTGFPKQFNGNGNTTLPYPGAHTGPNATLGSSDIDPNQFMVKARRSFQISQMRRSLSRSTRASTRSSTGFTIDSALVTAIGPGIAHGSTPSPSSSITSSASFAATSLDRVRECDDDDTGLRLAHMPTSTTASAMPEDLVAATNSAAADDTTGTNGQMGDSRPLTSESRSSFGSKRRRNIGRIFSRSRKNSN